MKKIKIIALLIPFFFTGCHSLSSVPSQSHFVKENKVVIGMPENEFISLYGEPYKKSFFYDSDSIFHEKLYYKEQIFNHIYYTINSVFEFKGSKLISQNQESEKKLYDNCNCDK